MNRDTESTGDELEVVEGETGADPQASVVWLHGLGADGHDFEPIVPDLALPDGPALRFIFPHAPVRPVTINAGYPMRAWYDIRSIDRSAPQDESGIRASEQAAARLIAREEERGIDAANIVLAGFSQGGGVAINTALRYPRRLAGVIGLSTWVPRIDSLESERNPANNEIPMFLAHGSMDPMVPEEHGKASADRIEALGYPVTWHSYPMMHGVCPEEIVHIREWLAAQLGSGGDCV